jgi:hypothetical protein
MFTPSKTDPLMQGKLEIKLSDKYMIMNDRLKLLFGVIFCLLGVIILTSSLILNKFLPGGFISLGIGIILITESKRTIK